MAARRGPFAWLLALAVLLAPAAALAAQASPLDPPPGMAVERVVMLFRHGVRAPIDGEAAAAAYARQPWPVWSTRAEFLTPHGREAMRRLGVFDRALFAREGLLPAGGCPAAADLWIWTNTAERTIASGQGLAEGLAPGCGVAVGHLGDGAADPLFDEDATGAPFDAKAAVASIQAYTGGLDRLVRAHRAEIATLETILGCRPCGLADIPSTLVPSADGRGVDLAGPIQLTSGTAQVLLLEYAEGLPLDQVGWGRATPARIARIARLHALQFDVYNRSPYMARHSAAALGPRLAQLIDGDGGARVSLLVGHDDNIAAVASLLGVHIRLPSYGEDDPPPGGAIGFEVLRARATGARYVRVFYQAQSLGQLRRLDRLSLARPPLVRILAPACAKAGRPCRIEALERRLDVAAGAMGAGRG